jgi:hypothetical protein
MERPADTTIYRLVHRAMVASAQRLAATATRPDHDRDAFAQWAAGFTAQLRWHQAEEDAVGFPQLVERVPAAATIVERLDADHGELDAVLDELDGALAAREDVSAPAGRLHDLLAAHVFDEDVNVAPLIERHLSYDEHLGAQVAAARRLPLREAAWTVPWLLAACSPQERPLVESVLPERLVSIDRLCARRYQRLEHAAFGAS